MGTDYGSFLEEAHRVLKPGGLLWIAEVRSRFDGKNGTASVASFVAALAALGFKRKRDVDERNTMFFTAEFIKTWVSKGKHSNTSTHRAVRWPPLKACTYKRR
jgi:ribosomal RNA-processing protein 8